MPDADGKIAIESITSPHSRHRVDRAKYMAMHEALMAVLPAKPSGLTVAEVEEIVPAGSFDPDCVHTPGIYVDRIVRSTINEKRIEKRTVREREAA